MGFINQLITWGHHAVYYPIFWLLSSSRGFWILLIWRHLWHVGFLFLAIRVPQKLMVDRASSFYPFEKWIPHLKKQWNYMFFWPPQKKHEQWQDTPYFYPFLTEKNPQQKQSSDSRILEDWAKWYDRETSAVRLPSSDLLLREGSAVLQDAWCYSLPWRMAIEIRGVSNKMGI